MSDINRRLSKVEQAAAESSEGRSQAARCREAAQTYLSLLRAINPAYKLTKPLPPASLPVARARACFAALMAAIAEQGQDSGKARDGQPTADNESDRHEKR